MRIHLTGAYWHGGITENIKKTLISLGHEVFFFNKNFSGTTKILKNLSLRLARRPYEIEHFFAKKRSRQWLESLVGFRPDLILIDDAPVILADYIKCARQMGKPIFYYVTAPPYGSGAKDQFLSFKYVDQIFSIDTKWGDLINGIFGVSVHHLPLAANPDHYYLLPMEKKIFDVVFVGSVPEQSPDGLIRASLIDQISEKYKVGVFGNGWKYWYRYFPELRKRVFSESALSISDLNKLYNQTKMVINFHSTGHDNSISSRIFEASLAGALVLTDYRKDLDILFPKNPFLIFKTSGELNNLIGQWILQEDKQKKIVERARKHILDNHTWKHRITRVLEYL